MAGNARTLEEVSAVIKHAKLDEADLQSCTQPLWLDKGLDSGDTRLLELDDDLLQHLSSGQSLVIRGEKSDQAVICSNSCTYEVRETETSNSLLIVPHLLWPAASSNIDVNRELVPQQIVAIHHTYLELRPCRPRLKKLHALLEQSLYRGPEYEEENVDPKYTMSDLLDKVQSSEEELHSALKELNACLISGFWRLLDFEYHFRVTNLILNLVEEESWPVNAVPLTKTLDVLDKLEPRAIIHHCFQGFCSARLDDKSTEACYELDQTKICRLFAEALLRSAHGKTDYDAFLEMWTLSVPEGFKPKPDFLKGLALVDTDSNPRTIRHYPVTYLPENIQQRFKELFQARDRWRLEEIQPYVEDLSTDKMDAKTLLTKYARSCMVNGSRCFFAK